jgi:hypothetical protein
MASSNDLTSPETHSNLVGHHNTTDDHHLAKQKSLLPEKWVHASRSAEVQALVDEGEYVDLDEDVYGAATFSIAYDFFEMFSGKDHDGLGITLNIYRVLFVVFLLICNYGLQIGLLGWVYLYVAMPQVHEAQEVYQNYHANVFEVEDNGVITWGKDRWANWDQVDELCNLAFANFWFMYAIICLWWVLMLTEVRKTERQWRKFSAIKDVKKAEEMITKVEKEGSVESIVIGLTPLTRFTLYTSILLPKILISVVLTVVGSVWLTASTGFSYLILNSVALEFIILVDEVLFEGLLPESVKQNIALTKIVIKASEHDPEAKERKTLAGYHRSTLYVILIVGGVYLFMTYGQYAPIIGVFPGYMNDAQCPVWWAEKTAEVCSQGKECFPIVDHPSSRESTLL